MEPGRLDRRITLLSRGTNTDDWNQRGTTYSSFATVWAHVSDPGTREREEADQRVTVRTKVFTIRYRSDVNTLTRISYDSDNYDVIGVAEIGRNEGLRITAVARDND